MALDGQRPDVLRGAIVYTTLEPCTVRGEQASCCSRLIKAGVAEVVIGMLDPNRDIRGRGWWELEDNRIRVRYFEPDIAEQVRHLNRDFIDYQLGVGLLITAVQPDGKPELIVTSDHRAKRNVLQVPAGRLMIRGGYRVKPTRGDRIVPFVRRGNNYRPQRAITFDYDQENRMWQAPSAYVWGNRENELIIARVSKDFDVAIRHYNTVHTALDSNEKLKTIDFEKWIPIVIETEPSGFESLAHLWVFARDAKA